MDRFHESCNEGEEGLITEAGEDSALASGDALMRWQGPFSWATQLEGPGPRSRAGALGLLGGG